jgi:opacity protein-like surface antigen
MKRALMMATVALLMAAMAMPALAAKPAPTKEECVGTLVAIQHGDKLTGQQQQLPKQFASFSDCIQASSG